jgi:hypothetical protein
MGDAVETREVSFDEFLHAFAAAVELAAAGEVEEGRALLADSRRAAAQRSVGDPVTQGGLLYRYDIAERIFDSRYR